MGRQARVVGKGRAGRRAPAGRPVRFEPGGWPRISASRLAALVPASGEASNRWRVYTPRTMPTFEKSPVELVGRFDEVATRHPSAQRRLMFGYPALFTGGNFATGLFADRWVVRLAPGDLADLLATPDAAPFSPMPGRAMSGWASLPRDVVADDVALDGWVERAIAFAASLPPKG